MKGFVLTYVEIDIDYCENTYGVAPCTASIPTTGSKKCFNCVKTCQDRDNYSELGATLRFSKDVDYLPSDIEVAAPSIVDVSYSPATISLGEDLGMRASITITFRDHPHSDTGVGFDKYLSSRSYDPFKTGSFWGKFRARHPFMRGKGLRWIMGLVGQDLEEMEIRNFVIDSVSGPTRDGVFTIVAKDALKLADDDRSQAPPLSEGSLVADVSSGATTATLTPASISQDYFPSGYAAIGNKEIVKYHRGILGNDSNCLLLLHFEGSDGATSTTDSSASARTVTRSGTAQIDTADYKWGTSSSLFDGAGDFWSVPDSSDWQFAGNFTLEAWIKIDSLSDSRHIMNHGTDANNQMRFSVRTTGSIVWDILSSGSPLISVASASGVIVINTWYHVAIVRNGNVFTLYVNGASVATVTQSVSIPNFTASFKTGCGVDGSTWPFSGWIDEVRVSNVARWTAAFTVPESYYVSSANIDVVTLVSRAQFNTPQQSPGTAIAHSAGDSFQQCLYYLSQDPADVMYDWLVNYVEDFDPSFITLSDWKTESASFFGRTVTGLLAQPTGVKTLLAEMIQQTASAMWWDEISSKVRWNVLKAVSTGAFTYDYDEIEAGTLALQEQPDKRISQVYTYFGQRNPLEPLEAETNYRAQLRTVSDNEVDYGSPVIKKIFSRWIPQFGTAVASKLNDIILSRYKVPPRAFSFEVFRRIGGQAPQLGAGYNLTGDIFQLDTGEPDTPPVQVTHLLPKEDRFVVEGEEALFSTDDTFDPLNPVITIDTDYYNLNIRTIYDSLYPSFDDGTGITLTININAGVKVGSNSTGSPALTIGSWPANLTIVLKNRGRLQGAGGAGGSYVSDDGGAGGTAIYTRYAITLDNAGGEIWGGGGGGAGWSGIPGGGVGGGGGAGNKPGAGGGSGPLTGVPDGTSGSATSGGGTFGYISGGERYDAGPGGGPGLAGQSATYSGGAIPPPTGGTPGAAGKAIDGISYVTVTAAGDRRGTEVN